MDSSKDTYQQQAEMRLKKIRTKITELEIKAGKAETGIKTRYAQKMTQLNGQYAQAANKLGELEKAGQDSWSDLRISVDEALNALSEAVDAVSQNIKIHPE